MPALSTTTTTTTRRQGSGTGRADALSREEARRRLEALLGVPFTTGNRVDVLRNGDEVFPAMLEAIAQATETVDMLWFLWGHGDVTERFTEALAARAEQGVQVRVLLDGFGARGIAADQLDRMRSAGCEVAFLRPFRRLRLTSLNLRTHRRALVCDGAVAFTGGTGIDQAWSGDADAPDAWRDTALRLRGPAVDGVRGAFAQDWLQTPHPEALQRDAFRAHGNPGRSAVQVLKGTAQPGWNECSLAILTLLDLARDRVRITTPYARLPEHLHAGIRAAVRRGVTVQLLVSGPSDRSFVAAQSRAHHGRLLDAGVELWTYEQTLLHAKCITVDGVLAFVGTTNLDVRSIATNEQVNLVIDDPEVTAVLDRHFDDDLAGSRRLSPDRWRARGVRERLVDTAATVLGAPLQGLPRHGQTGPRP